jgi:hypothetical protein
MRTLYVTVVLAALGLGGIAHAQPTPYHEPRPDLGNRPQCTPDYVESVKRLIEGTEKLRTSGPEAIGRICSLIEMGSAWFGGELPDDLRQKLREQLGFDIDLPRLQTQCRSGQQKLASELARKLAQLRAELVRCDDSI